jgi:apolipoprotein N-acyltransferase
MKNKLSLLLQRCDDVYQAFSVWPRRLIAFIAGVLLTLAFPPILWVPFAFIGLATFLFVIDRAGSKKEAWLLGWWFGFGHFTTGLYWIAMALTVDLASFGWLIPFALTLIPAAMAIFIAFVAYGVFRIGANVLVRWLALAWLWFIFEWIRGHIFTGFPWNLVGYIWVVSEPVLQLVSVIGVWGLGFATILWLSSPVLLLRPLSWYRQPFYWLSLCFIIAGIWGQQRLESPTQYHADVKVRVVQANIDQNHKWDEYQRMNILRKHMELSVPKENESFSHIIWPESALPYFVYEGAEVLKVVGSVVPESGFLLSGTVRTLWNATGFTEQLWNSVHVIDQHGAVLGHYDKSHLVPFGEYVPFRGILPIEKITHGIVDFSAGEGVQTLNVGGFPSFSPLVCYEAIFPDAVSNKENRPELLINVTNDGWYGNHTGPYQHFEMVRVRAVEEGVPLIRAANTGISGVVDPYGRVLHKTAYGVETVIDSSIPRSIATTFYSIYRNYILISLVIGGFLVIFFVTYRFHNH